jgi:hypothetical protein
MQAGKAGLRAAGQAGIMGMVFALDGPAYQEASLWNWIAKAPRRLLANNFGVAESFVPSLAAQRPVIVGSRRASSPPALTRQAVTKLARGAGPL